MVTRFKRAFGSDAPFVAKVLGASLLLHLIAAVFSIGQHSADEHFQILEFLNFKLGLTPASVLAVEYGEKMRPWFQPGFYFLIVKLAQAVGVADPLVWAFCFRLVSSLIGWASLVALSFCVPIWFPLSASLRRLAWGCIAFLWYLPGLHARTSSENFSGSFFLLGACGAVLLLAQTQGWGRRWRWGSFWAGICLGLAFESRFQVGVMVFGFLAWLLVMGQVSARAMGPILGGVMAAVVFGRAVDYWGYGEWVCSPWNYLDYNLVRNEVNRYGRSPWWDVFRMSFTESWPLLGSLVAVLSVLAWVREPRHPLTWSYLPFFVVHCLIAHKELRFFFPIASGAMVLIPLALGEKGWVWLRSRRVLWGALLVLNGAGVLAMISQPFSRVIYFQAGIYREVGGDQVTLWTEGKDPYEILGTDTYFYRAPGISVRNTTFAELNAVGPMLSSRDLIFAQSFALPAEYPELSRRCRRVFSTLPDWIVHLNFNDWLSRSSIWTLWRCDG